jgi:hypothetical protein
MPSLKDVLGYNDKISGHRLQRSISIYTLLETFQIPNVNIKQTNIEIHSKVLVNILISVNAKLVSPKIQNVYAGTKYKIITSLTKKTSGMKWGIALKFNEHEEYSLLTQCIHNISCNFKLQCAETLFT